MEKTFLEWMNTKDIYLYQTIAELKDAYNYYLSV